MYWCWFLEIYEYYLQKNFEPRVHLFKPINNLYLISNFYVIEYKNLDSWFETRRKNFQNYS